MESIAIKKFAGIDNLEITLNRINVFIGAQASGKSVTAKLIYFFKGVTREFLDEALDEKPNPEIDKRLLLKFERYFPADTWPSRNFEIVYRINSHYISIKKEKGKVKIAYSEVVGKLFSHCKKIISLERKKYKPRSTDDTFDYTYRVRQKCMSVVEKELGVGSAFFPLFVPAGRSFYANLQNSIFSFLSTNKTMEPFLLEFGSFYEGVKLTSQDELSTPVGEKMKAMIDSRIAEIIGGKHHREENKDFLIHADKRKINVAFASSGQQETLPLLLILKSLFWYNFAGGGSSLFIEEPEAHLFPSAQKRVVELMGLVFNNAANDTQLVITTHSPYVLTSINNLVQASIIHKAAAAKDKKKVEHVVSKEIMIDEAFINAYAFKDGGAESIVDKETGLIHSAYLDKVSEEIAIQFDSLLNL